MNEKFFALPEEKQRAILNGGYQVFSRNAYKKSPVSEIAAAAGISKSLLFYYFRNKKELYLFLLDKCAEITIDTLTACGCYEQTDLFEMMYRGTRAKIRIMRQYPELSIFAIRTYYERDPEVRDEVQARYDRYTNFKASAALANVDPSAFIPGLDLQMMYRNMYWASQGWLWERLQRDEMDADTLERELMTMLDFWKSVYLRRE